MQRAFLKLASRRNGQQAMKRKTAVFLMQRLRKLVREERHNRPGPALSA